MDMQQHSAGEQIGQVTEEWVGKGEMTCLNDFISTGSNNVYVELSSKWLSGTKDLS